MSTMKSERRPRKDVESVERPPEEVVDRLAELLPEGALDDAVRGLKPEELSGPGGLLSQLAGRVVEAALEAEMTEHLGHPPGGRPQGPNVRNGAGRKTLQTDLGPVEIRTPRDRDATFEPRLVGKRQTRLAGLDDKILGLYAGGMTVRDISGHLSELYRTEIGRDTISRVTDAVLEDVVAWRTRPLDPVYPIVYFDAMVVKVREDRSVRNRACYLALGVTCDGDREVLGIWWQETEGAKFWLAVLNDLRRRGVEDVLIACVDGLKGFPEAIEATFPQAWVQTCIVHLIRASLRYVNYRDQRKVASALRPIYTAANADQALVELERFDAEWASATRRPSPPGAPAGSTSSPSSRCPTSCAKRSTRPTRSKDCTARSAKRSRPAGTSPTNKPRPSSSTSPSSRPTPNGEKTAPGQRPALPSKSTSETASPANHQPTSRHGLTHRRTDSLADWLRPTSLAIDLVDQCVASFGDVSSVLTITSSTMASVIFRG
jgi:putative transposase